MVLFTLLRVEGRATPDDSVPDPKLEASLKELLPRWDWSVTLHGSAGFNDNVALSCCNPEASPFVQAGLEVIGLRLPFDGNQFTVVFSGEDSQFFSSETVDHEDLVVAQAEFRKFFDNDWEAAFGLETLYLNQVVDLSVTENIRQPLLVQGATATGRPGVRRNLSDAIWLTVELPASRQYYNGTIDDYFEVGPKVLLGRTYGNDSEIAAVYEFIYRGYDTEPALAVDSNGGLLVVSAIPGETRAADQHEVGVVWKHYWEKARRWRSTTRFSFRRNTDNGGGYYDYDRFQVAHQIRFHTKVWEASAEARAGFYRFPVQTIAADSPVRRERTDLLVTLRLERKLGRHARLFAQYEYEAAYANRQGDDYAANTTSGGLAWEF
jgi:hypothetical protein